MKNAQNPTTVNRTELLHHCRETFGAAVTEGGVDSLLDSGNAELFETGGRPQENPRLEITRLFLDTMIKCFKWYVPSCWAELVFN
jgi:hypothetical protein